MGKWGKIDRQRKWGWFFLLISNTFAYYTFSNFLLLSRGLQENPIFPATQKKTEHGKWFSAAFLYNNNKIVYLGGGVIAMLLSMDLWRAKEPKGDTIIDYRLRTNQSIASSSFNIHAENTFNRENIPTKWCKVGAAGGGGGGGKTHIFTNSKKRIFFGGEIGKLELRMRRDRQMENWGWRRFFPKIYMVGGKWNISQAKPKFIFARNNTLSSPFIPLCLSLLSLLDCLCTFFLPHLSPHYLPRN